MELWDLYKVNAPVQIGWFAGKLMDTADAVGMETPFAPFHAELYAWLTWHNISIWDAPWDSSANIRTNVRNLELFYGQVTDESKHVPDRFGIEVMRQLLMLWTAVWRRMDQLRRLNLERFGGWDDHDIAAWAAMHDAFETHRSLRPRTPDDEDRMDVWDRHHAAVEAWLQAKPPLNDLQFYRLDVIASRARMEEPA